MKLEEVSSRVRRALEQQGGVVGEIEKKKRNGRVVCEAEIERKGKQIEVEVDVKGEFLSREVEMQFPSRPGKRARKTV